MLAADKDNLIAEIKVQTLCLRQKELEYYVQRYSNITTQCTVLAGFAFDSLVEIEVPEKMQRERSGVCLVYYISAAATMAFALYTVCVSGFATVYGQRLALTGPTGSVEKAVAVMMLQRTTIFVTFGLAMVSLVVAASTMAWLVMDQTGHGEVPAVVSALFLLFFLMLLYKKEYMKGAFFISAEDMVQGDVRLNLGAAEVDVSRLEAGTSSATAEPSLSSAARPSSRVGSEPGPSGSQSAASGMSAAVYDTIGGGRPAYEERRDAALYAR